MNLGRKITGGKYHKQKKRKLYERRNQERIALLAEETKRKQLRTRSGSKKTILLKTNMVNLTAGKKTQKAIIKNVLETPQNKFFARQNRLLKGAIIETSLGKARITNRPTQEGSINAILIE